VTNLDSKLKRIPRTHRDKTDKRMEKNYIMK
jgi:hypothetical protein